MDDWNEGEEVKEISPTLESGQAFISIQTMLVTKFRMLKNSIVTYILILVILKCRRKITSVSRVTRQRILQNRLTIKVILRLNSS